jgi:Xaa-Pro aminopeptidase
MKSKGNIFNSDLIFDIMIKSYKRAADSLVEIKEKAIGVLKGNVTEKRIASLILSEYKKKGLKTQGKPKVIVSFGKNSSEIHHSPENKALKAGPVMVDIWAKQPGGCYADMTFMAYKGNPDKEFIKMFRTYVNARNSGIEFLKKCLKKKYLPSYFELDSIARSYLAKKFLGYHFQHRIGHSLGKKVHAGGKREYYERLRINQPYTLEPGIYFKNKFGIRLENDFWIDKNFSLHIDGLQNTLIII